MKINKLLIALIVTSWISLSQGMFTEEAKKFIKENGTLSVRNDDDNEHAQIHTWSYNHPYAKFLGFTWREQRTYFSERKILNEKSVAIDQKFVEQGVELPRWCLKSKLLFGIIASGISYYLYNCFCNSNPPVNALNEASNRWDYYLSK